MRVLSLALDPKALDSETVVAFRAKAYGEYVGRYSVIVPSTETLTTKLSKSTTIYGVGGQNKVFQLVRIFLQARKLIKEGDCDVITTQDMYFLGLTGYILASMHNVGLEIQVLGIEKLTTFRKSLAKFVLKKASVVRALSVRLNNRLINEFDVKQKNINIVPIYVDIKKLGLDIREQNEVEQRKFQESSKEFRSKYGEYVNFLTVSRLVSIKRISTQLRALKNVLKSVPNAFLHIVGTGPDEEILKKEVIDLGLEKNVLFHGYQTGTDLGLFYIESDCFLLTSDYEGWGMVIVEAMTAGLPVIMTDVGCAGELVIDEQSGIIISIRDTEALTSAMKRVATDSKLRNRLSEGATAALQTLPSFETVLKKYKENWEVALNKPL